MIKIIPSILTNSPDEFEEMMRLIQPHFLSTHLDIADEIFVPNKTIEGINELERLHTSLKITVHLMVSEPEKILPQWLAVGEVEALIFHVESTKQMDKLISETKSKGNKVGIAVNPDTPIEEIIPFVENVDFVHFMTVDPGFYGSEFREEVLGKIRNFRKKYDDVEIRVDGGINPGSARKIVEAGANVLIVGSYFFRYGQGGDIVSSLENMERSVL